MPTIVGSILLAADQQLRVEQLAVGTSADLVNGLSLLAPSILVAESAAYRGVQVDEDGARNVFAIASLREEGLERAALVELLRIGVRTTISLEAVLKKVPEEASLATELMGRVGSRYVQLPGAVTELGTGLADVEVADLQSAMSAHGLQVRTAPMFTQLDEPLTFNATLRSSASTQPMRGEPTELSSCPRRVKGGVLSWERQACPGHTTRLHIPLLAWWMVDDCIKQTWAVGSRSEPRRSVENL